MTGDYRIVPVPVIVKKSLEKAFKRNVQYKEFGYKELNYNVEMLANVTVEGTGKESKLKKHRMKVHDTPMSVPGPDGTRETGIAETPGLESEIEALGSESDAEMHNRIVHEISHNMVGVLKKITDRVTGEITNIVHDEMDNTSYLFPFSGDNQREVKGHHIYKALHTFTPDMIIKDNLTLQEFQEKKKEYKEKYK